MRLRAAVTNRGARFLSQFRRHVFYAMRRARMLGNLCHNFVFGFAMRLKVAIGTYISTA